MSLYYILTGKEDNFIYLLATQVDTAASTYEDSQIKLGSGGVKQVDLPWIIDTYVLTGSRRTAIVPT